MRKFKQVILSTLLVITMGAVASAGFFIRDHLQEHPSDIAMKSYFVLYALLAVPFSLCTLGALLHVLISHKKVKV